jgi:uncharacterized protein DUF4232
MRRGVLLVGAVAMACSTPLPSASQTTEPVSSTRRPTAQPTSDGTAVGACEVRDLSIVVTNTTAAMGNVGGYLMFTNRSAGPCALAGAPKLIALTAVDAPTVARVELNVGTPFPDAHPQVIILAPGDRAFAAYGGSDNPGDKPTCGPPYHLFHVSPPGGSEGVDMSAFNASLGQDQPSCAGISVTAIESAATAALYIDQTDLHP